MNNYSVLMSLTIKADNDNDAFEVARVLNRIVSDDYEVVSCDIIDLQKEEE
jgi:hypothetical protein